MKFIPLTAVLFLLLSPTLSHAAGKTEITWYGQSAFKVKTPGGKILLIDPWIDNPVNKNAKDDLAKLTKTDLILLTHGHGDHIGNAVEIGKKTKAKLVAPYGLLKSMTGSAGYPAEQAGMDGTGNFGGEISLLEGEVKVAFIPALHDSDMTIPGVKGASPIQIPGGNPAGFLITIKNGPAIYHTGDTDLFSDMALVKEFRPVDILLVCIGDRFTMGPSRAAKAADLVDAEMIVPMHFGTFPLLTGTPEQFRDELEKVGLEERMRRMTPGETLVWEKK